MGLTLCGKFKESPSYDMGYGSFYRLRCDIANTVSKEFGKHYRDIYKVQICPKEVLDEYNRRTESLIKKYKCKERFLEFLYLPDTEGKLSPFKCKAVMEQITDLKNTDLYGYTAYPETCMTIEKFRELLNLCYNKRKYLIWY